MYTPTGSPPTPYLPPRPMTDRTDDWRTIFGDLTTDGVYEMCEINAYKLTSHLEELYLKIAELEAKLND